MRTILTSIIVAAAALPSVAAAQDAPATSDQDVIVTGSKYRGDIATSGARIDVSTRDLPLSISVLTDALIQDRQVRNLRDGRQCRRRA